MRNIVGKMTLAATGLVLAAALTTGAALATPTCTSIQNLGPSGAGLFLKSSFTSGFCVLAKDKLYGNFNLSNLPTFTAVTFNLNSVAHKDYYQIAFGSTYDSGQTYNWSFEVAVSGAPAGTKIVELDTDFTQTAGGPSTLQEILTPGGTVTQTKTAALTTNPTQTFFPLGLTDIIFNMSLQDTGTVSSVTNTIVQLLPSRNNVPEPLSLSLFGAGLAGLGMMRRKRRD